MVDIGLQFAIIWDWIDNLLCRFSNSGFSTQSFWFQNMNMWLFKLISSHYWWRKKMNKVLYIILISLFSFIIFSCSEKDEHTTTTDTTSPVIAEVTAVTTPSTDSTPNYTFSSTEAGTITYGGSCSSSTTHLLLVETTLSPSLLWVMELILTVQ